MTRKINSRISSLMALKLWGGLHQHFQPLFPLSGTLVRSGILFSNFFAKAHRPPRTVAISAAPREILVGNKKNYSKTINNHLCTGYSSHFVHGEQKIPAARIGTTKTIWLCIVFRHQQYRRYRMEKFFQRCHITKAN